MKSKVILTWITLIVFGFCSNCYAAESNNTLKVVQKASETKYLENDQGYISKTIVDSNASTGEVTIELKVSNTKKETTVSNDTEIVLVIDNSPSMKFKTAAGETRKQIVINSAKALVNSIYNTSSNVKMSVIKFSGETSLWSPLHAASVVTELTSEKQKVLDGLTNIETKYYMESGTNIQKGLIKAEETFSENAGKKLIILLTDGCPNEDAQKNAVTDSKMVITDETYLKILENTKNELLNINKKGITLISLMTGVNSNDVDEKGNTITSTEDDKQAIAKIFGTESKPTAGKFYNAKTTDVSNVVKNNITADVTKMLNTPLNTTKVVDYFTKDITDNFEFSYVGNPSKGTKTESIDKNTNSITWDIGTLRGDEVATVKYKLKIKDMNNKALLNKTIATNEKVVLTYADTRSKNYTVALTSSPTIQLTEDDKEDADKNTVNNINNINKNYNSNKEVDNTVAKSPIPQTGEKLVIYIAIIMILVISVIIHNKLYKLKDIE